CALWLSFFGRQNLINLNKGRLQDLFTKAARQSARLQQGWDTQQQGAGTLNARQLLALDPATLPSTTPASEIVNVVDTFLGILGWALYKKEDAKDDMIDTAMDWFDADEDTARARIVEFGGEMVNAITVHGRREDPPGYHPMSDYTPEQFLYFFNKVGSAALRDALRA